MGICDHCGDDTDLIVSNAYDLQLCPNCQRKFNNVEMWEKESLWKLAREQNFWEDCAIPYVYNEP